MLLLFLLKLLVFCAIIDFVGYSTHNYHGVEVFSTLDLYNLAWQAGLICTLVGSNTIIAERDSLIAELKNSLFPQPALQVA